MEAWVWVFMMMDMALLVHGIERRGMALKAYEWVDRGLISMPVCLEVSDHGMGLKIGRQAF